MVKKNIAADPGIPVTIRFQPTPTHLIRIDFPCRFSQIPVANNQMQLDGGIFRALVKNGLELTAWKVDRVFHLLSVDEKEIDNRASLVAVLVPDPPLTGKALAAFQQPARKVPRRPKVHYAE